MRAFSKRNNKFKEKRKENTKEGMLSKRKKNVELLALVHKNNFLSSLDFILKSSVDIIYFNTANNDFEKDIKFEICFPIT
jgi:hypothetical protein